MRNDRNQPMKWIAAIAGLAAVFALLGLGGMRLTPIRVLFSALMIGLGIFAVVIAERIRRISASWWVRCWGLSVIGFVFALSPWRYFDQPLLDHAAAYLRHGAPLCAYFGILTVSFALLPTVRGDRSFLSLFKEGRAVWQRYLIAAAVLIVMGAYIPLRRNYYPSHDFSIFAYIGKRILAGGLPYVDAWDHKPPLIFYLNALGLWLAGGNLVGIWTIEIVFVLSAALLLFALLRFSFQEWAALAAAVGAILHLARLLDFGNYTEEFAFLFQIAAVILWIRAENGGSFGRWLVSGVLMGLSFSLKPTLIGAWIGIGAMALLDAFFIAELPGKTRFVTLIRQFGGLLLGFAAANLVWVGIFSAHGALGDYLEGAFAYNWLYAAKSGASRWATGWTSWTFLPSLSPFMAFGAVCWLGVIWRLLSRRRSGELARFIRANRLIAWAALTLPIEVFLSGLSGMNYQHYFIPLMLSYSILIAAGLERLAGWFSVRFPKARHLAAPGLMLLVLAASLPMARMIAVSYTERHPSAMTKTGDFLRAQSQLDDRVMIWGGSAAPYLLAERVSPSRFFIVKSLYDFAAEVGDSRWDTFLSEMAANPPKFIVYIPDGRMGRVPLDAQGFCAPGIAVIPGEARAFAQLCPMYRYRETINEGALDAYGVFERNGD